MDKPFVLNDPSGSTLSFYLSGLEVPIAGTRCDRCTWSVTDYGYKDVVSTLYVPKMLWLLNTSTRFYLEVL